MMFMACNLTMVESAPAFHQPLAPQTLTCSGNLEESWWAEVCLVAGRIVRPLTWRDPAAPAAVSVLAPAAAPSQPMEKAGPMSLQPVCHPVIHSTFTELSMRTSAREENIVPAYKFPNNFSPLVFPGPQ